MMIIKNNYAVDVYTVLPQFRQGVRHWNNGFPYNCSTGICGFFTYGYGKLDEFGYWEFPFPTELAELDIISAENKMRWNKQREEERF